MTAKRKPAWTPSRYGIELMPPSNKRGSRAIWIAIAFIATLLLAALMGCTQNAKQSSKRSTEPTPVVACDEHAPFEPLPPYPAAPGADDAASLRAYSDLQSEWAVDVAGITQRNGIKRNATAACLDDYRRRGVIL